MTLGGTRLPLQQGAHKTAAAARCAAVAAACGCVRKHWSFKTRAEYDIHMLRLLLAWHAAMGPHRGHCNMNAASSAPTQQLALRRHCLWPGGSAKRPSTPGGAYCAPLSLSQGTCCSSPPPTTTGRPPHFRAALGPGQLTLGSGPSIT
jgi:hypothetical protein